MFREKKRELLGICGVYCGACETYRAYNDKDKALFEWEIKAGMPADEIYCRGCGSDLVNKWCSKCQFRTCARRHCVKFCFECKDFPCKKLVDFSKTRPHRTLGLKNLQQLRQMTIDEWLKQQEKRWACPKCRKKLHWYAKKCNDCGAEFTNAIEEARSPTHGQT